MNIPLRNEFPEFWEFLGIPRNSSLFQDMQMRKDEKPWNIWEYLGMGENISENFWEFLGIRNNSKFGGNCLWNLWELLGITKTPMRIYGNS